MSSDEKKVTRRRYLELTGGAIAGLVVGGALGYVAKPAVTAPAETVTATEMVTVTGTVTAPPPATAAATVGQVALTQTGTPQGDGYWKVVVPKFQNAYPNITVNWTSIRREDFDAAFKTHWAAKSAFDILCYDPQFYLDYYSHGIPLDISDYLGNPKYPNLTEDHFVAGALDFKRMKGRTFVIPCNLIMFIWYYNKDIYNKYNISVPVTWDDLLTVADKLKGTGIAPLGMAGKENWWFPGHFYQPLAAVTGNKEATWIREVIRGDRKWTDPVTIKTLEYVQQMFKPPSPHTTPLYTKEQFGYSTEGLTTQFVTGKCATVMQGTWFYAENLKTSMPKGFALGTFQQPDTPEGKGQPHGCTDVLESVASTSQYVDESLRFIDFVHSDENMKTFADQGFIPAVKTVPASDPYMAGAIQQIKDKGVAVEHLTDHLWEPEITQAFQVDVQKLWLGQMTPEQVAADLENVRQTLVAAGKDYAYLYK